MVEVPYAQQPLTQSSEPRVLMRDGQWLVPPGDRPANWRELERPVSLPPPRPESKEASLRPRVGRPRINPPKAHPFAGRGKAWNRKESVTDEQVAALRAEGMSFGAISKRTGLHPSTAHKRLTALAKRLATAGRVA